MKKLESSQIERLSIESFRQASKQPICFILDNIRSLHNVGATFRTADAFAIEKIYLCGITGTPPNREIQKTALGATETVIWEHISDIQELILKLKKEGYVIICVEQTDKSILLHNFEAITHQKYAFIFGNEVFGVSDEAISMCDYSIEIPQFGTKHSLNVSVSVGIIAWHFTQALLKKA